MTSLPQLNVPALLVMLNPAGVNGSNNGTRPSDDVLGPYLHSLANCGLKLQDRFLYLEKDFGYIIKLTKLKKHNREFGVGTVCKPPPMALATTAVCAAVAEDPAARNGPSTIQNEIHRSQNIFIPQDTCWQIMLKSFSHGAKMRFPGKQKPRPLQGKLQRGDGPFHEVHCDGHEKLNQQALCMGEVSIDQYRMRDHSSGRILSQVVVPNAQCSSTVAHIYLDYIEKYGMVFLQVTVDGGSETGEMYACHRALREKYFPGNTQPSSVALKSVHNIIIESSWGQWLKFGGDSLHETIEHGKTSGYFVQDNNIHVNLFHWLWSKIVQKRVDEFVDHWDNHLTRRHSVSNLSSGVSPRMVFDFPAHFGMRMCGQKVSQEDINELQATIPKP
ncbi:hypothetical protein Moror_5856 [Moniliophthora roreri MCA 2997]|uniref:Integrase core domain-containing protein n=1 Tax=Moniliophthora roreri (strain MCA 2997) TaxID=1381753 RepID=V2X423_MONRO|nr:hypothetical protein Moror_5856 [Moniliophthora roreri MCA 2997]